MRRRAEAKALITHSLETTYDGAKFIQILGTLTGNLESALLARECSGEKT